MTICVWVSFLPSGVTIGRVVVQLLVVVVDLRRLGFRIPVYRPRYTKSAKRLLALGIPGVIAGGVTQINIAVGQIIASLQEGANALLYFADRLYQLPLGGDRDRHRRGSAAQPDYGNCARGKRPPINTV